MNKAILIGNLTKDPEIITTTNGISVCRFTLAINRNFTNAEGERDADFINVTAWRTLGENAHKYLAKGKKAGVVGSIQTRSYDAEDGTKRYVTEIVASEIEFLSQANKNGSPAPGDNDAPPTAQLEPIDDNDLPF